jgi:hypothetical protein
VTPRFTRIADDGLRVTLSTPELELLRSLPDELRMLYETGDENDPVRSRLFPRAYLDPTAEDAEQEWRELVHPELLRERLAAVELVVASLAEASAERDIVVADLTADDVAAWLAVLNDARLALGTRLEVTEETDIAELDVDDPAAPGLAAYAWLTYLEGELIETLLGGMPE